MQTEPVDITGIDRAELLCRLWHATKVVGMGWLEEVKTVTREEASTKLHCTGGGVDYFYGKPIKLDLSEDRNMLDPYDYDRHAGVGKCQEVVGRLRRQLPPQPIPDEPVVQPPPPPPSPACTPEAPVVTVMTFQTTADALDYIVAHCANPTPQPQPTTPRRRMRQWPTMKPLK